MFSQKRDESNTDAEIKTLREQLQLAEERYANQKNSNDAAEERRRNGRNGGFMPPNMARQLLQHYASEVTTIKERLTVLEDSQFRVRL